MSDWLLLDWHKGLGDAIACNGLVRCLIKKGERLTLPCHARNYESICAMFSDISTNQLTIDPGEIVNDHAKMAAMGYRILHLGFAGKDFDGYRWDESFYRQAGVPFIEKWNSFELGVSGIIGATECGGMKTFIHDDHSRGYRIPLHGIRPNPQYAAITEWVETLMHCDEIHCINSCFAILADLIKAPGKLFLHAYARPNSPLPIFGQHWTVLQSASEIPN